MKAIAFLAVLLILNGARASVVFEPRFTTSSGNRISISWETASENQNSHFLILRRDSTSEYGTLTTLQGHGTRTFSTIYLYDDTTGLPIVDYQYMIVDVDSSGIQTEHPEWQPWERPWPTSYQYFMFRPICPEDIFIIFSSRYEQGLAEHIIVRRSFEWPERDTVTRYVIESFTDSSRVYTFIDTTAQDLTYDYYVIARDVNGEFYRPLWFRIPEWHFPDVYLSRCQLERSTEGVRIEWETSLENWLRCFSVQRKPVEDSLWTTVVEVSSSGHPFGGDYNVLDTTADAQVTYNYRLGYHPNLQSIYEELCDTVLQAIASSEDTHFHPHSYSLSAFPNPFNPTTTISLDLAKSGETKIIIYDIAGREIETLFSGNLTPGAHEFTFSGESLPSGIYFARVQSGEFGATQKLLLLK